MREHTQTGRIDEPPARHSAADSVRPTNTGASDVVPKVSFGKPSPQELMASLLQGPGTQMADEMERVYRGQIESYSQDFSACEVNAKGLLKARLFGVSFALLVFRKKSGSTVHLPEMMNASSGLAMLPFNSPGSAPSISREGAASFAGEYMTRVVKNLLLELEHGPSTPTDRSVGFTGLVSCYEEALIESIGASNFTSQVKQRFYPMVAGAVYANLGFMHQSM